MRCEVCHERDAIKNGTVCSKCFHKFIAPFTNDLLDNEPLMEAGKKKPESDSTESLVNEKVVGD